MSPVGLKRLKKSIKGLAGKISVGEWGLKGQWGTEVQLR